MANNFDSAEKGLPSLQKIMDGFFGVQMFHYVGGNDVAWTGHCSHPIALRRKPVTAKGM